jgi:hypothetical protein
MQSQNEYILPFVFEVSTDYCKLFFFPCLKLTGLRKKLVTLKWEDNNYSTVEISGLDIGWGQVCDVKAFIRFCIMFKPFKHFYLFIFISLSFSRGYL